MSYSDEELAYIKHVERVENIMVVLDDALEVVCSPAERLQVIEAVCDVLNVQPDCVELWQHVTKLQMNEEVLQ